MYYSPLYPYPFVKLAEQQPQESFWSTAWQTARPYLGAAGIGAGLGGLGAFGGAYFTDKDWKKALKAALIGAVTGAIAAPAVYGGYRYMTTPAPAPPANATT